MKNKIIEEVVCKQLGKANIDKQDILSIKELDLSNKNLNEIEEISEFTNLEVLNLTENCLSDLYCLKSLTKLRVLRAGNNPFLSNEERMLRKGENHYDDYSFLDNLKCLENVEFTDTDIDNIEFVHRLPNVVQFRAYSNPITDISSLKYCTKIEKAYFFNCPISDISVCYDLPNLCGLAINETNASDLSPIKNKNNFTYLDAHGSKITDISPIQDMTKMNYLTLAGTIINDINPIMKMKELEWLTLEVGDNLSMDMLCYVLPQLTRLKTVALNNFNYSKNHEEILKSKMPNKKIKFNQFGVF